MKRILIIEDNAKHIQDAKEVVDQMEGIEADFAENYVQAEALLKSNDYFGIVSDIFFPYDDSNREGFPLGWSDYIRDICSVELENHISYFRKDIRDIDYIKAYSRWVEGYDLHPSGLVLAKVFKKAFQPFVFCTDTYHHGYKTEPVNMFARENGIRVIDLFDKEELGGDEYTGQGNTKRWKDAIEKLDEVLEVEKLNWEFENE